MRRIQRREASHALLMLSPNPSSVDRPISVFLSLFSHLLHPSRCLSWSHLAARTLTHSPNNTFPRFVCAFCPSTRLSFCAPFPGFLGLSLPASILPSPGSVHILIYPRSIPYLPPDSSSPLRDKMDVDELLDSQTESDINDETQDPASTLCHTGKFCIFIFYIRRPGLVVEANHGATSVVRTT